MICVIFVSFLFLMDCGTSYNSGFHTGAHNLRSIYDIMVCEVRNISQVCDAIITADLPYDNSLMRTIFEKGGFLTEQNAYFEFLKRPEKVPHFGMVSSIEQ